MIKRVVALQDPVGSNLFLRCLWAELRNRFGGMGWQYTPRRYGSRNQIRFGWVTLGNTSTSKVEIGIKYKRKGIVDLIYFDPECGGADIHPDFDILVNASIDAALSNHIAPPEFERCARVTSNPPLPVAFYRSEKWYVGPLEDHSTEIGLKVRAFDEVDLDYEFKHRLIIMLNMLAAWTNCVFTVDSRAQPEATAIHQSELWKDADWIDDHPIEGGLIHLEENQLKYGDLLVQGQIDSNHKISRATHHFAEGLRFLRAGSPGFYKLATVHLVSSLEVVSLPEDGSPQSCAGCGQPVYRISGRVVDFGVGHLGEGAKTTLQASYAKRSRYLHTGGSDFAQPTTQKTIPMLDPSAPEGCAMPEVIEYPINLMEFTSFIIRAEVREYIKLLQA